MLKLLQKAIEWRRKEAESGNRLVIWGMPLVLLVLLVFAIIGFAKWSNANSGFVTGLGLFLIVPFSIISSGILERRRSKQKAEIALQVLQYELFHNLNYVSQIERSYTKNIPMIQDREERRDEALKLGKPVEIAEDEPYVAIPHSGPRVAVIEKYITDEHLFNLTPPLPQWVSEIYAQLTTLREEFVRWRDWLVGNDLDHLATYVGLSSTMLNIVEPSMRNMVRVWVEIVRDIGVTSEFPQIHEAGRLVHEVTKDGQMYITAYKASWVRDNVKDIIQDGTIVCWVDDWPNSPSKVLELSKVAALHPSWIQSQS